MRNLFVYKDIYGKATHNPLIQPPAKQFLEEFVGSVADMYFVNDGPQFDA